MDPAPQSILIACGSGRLLWANRAASRSVGQVIGRDLADFAPRDGASVREFLSLAENSSQPLLLRLKLPGGIAVWHVWRVAPESGGAPVLILQEDPRQRIMSRFLSLKREALDIEADRERTAATERRLRAEAAHLQKMVRTDRLTGVMNAAGIEEFVRQTLSDPERRGVFVFADLDGFKAVNDTLGHDAGDAVLKAVARRFSGATRTGDAVARLGGDEFAFWFDGMTEADLEKILARLEELVDAPIEWRDRSTGKRATLRVGASFGQALAPRDGTSFAALKAVSDARMYAMKRRKYGRQAV